MMVGRNTPQSSSGGYSARHLVGGRSGMVLLRDAPLQDGRKVTEREEGA